MSLLRFGHAIVFTGHRIDAPGRQPARFPARAEFAAKKAVLKSLARMIGTQSPSTIVGIAGGASGGDLLFHEACRELSIQSMLRLALPVEEYIDISVAPAGPDWVERFHAVLQLLRPGSVETLDDSMVSSKLTTGGEELDIWQRTNLWMVEDALSLAPSRTLLALWDGKAGNGPGGTEHLVRSAAAFGLDVAPIIHTQSLFDETLG